MKIGILTLLYADAWISVLTFSIFTFVVLTTFNPMAELNTARESANLMSSDMAELNTLAPEYLLHPVERVKQQWDSKYKSLHTLIASSRTADVLLLDYKNLGSLFTQIVTINEEKKRLIQTGASQKEIDETISINERLATNLIITSQSLNSKMSQISKDIHTKRIESQMFATNLIMYLSLGTLAILVLFSFFVSRRISKPIKDMATLLDEITKGNLDVKIQKSNIREIQSLSNSLNRILSSLKLAVLKTGLTKGELGLSEALEAKAEAETKYKALFENAPDAVFVTDFFSRKVLEANKAAESLSRYHLKELAGKEISCFVPKGGESGFQQVMMDLQKSGSAKAEVAFLRKDKKAIDTLVSATLINAGNRKVIYAIFKDMTVEKLAEKEQKKKQEELERFAKLAEGRELKMIELKKRIVELEKKLAKRK